MKCPSKCPACGGNFRFDFIGIEENILVRSCDMKVDHKISFETIKNEEIISNMDITINMEKQIKVRFWFKSKDIFLLKPNSAHNLIINNTLPPQLPWFEPDLSDYKKLIEKLKTYIAMS